MTDRVIHRATRKEGTVTEFGAATLAVRQPVPAGREGSLVKPG